MITRRRTLLIFLTSYALSAALFWPGGAECTQGQEVLEFCEFGAATLFFWLFPALPLAAFALIILKMLSKKRD